MIGRDVIDAPGFVPHQAERISVASFDGEAVLYDADNARPFLLNSSAAAVWGLIDGRRSVLQIADALSLEFSAERALVFSDVVDGLVALDGLGLLSTRLPRS